MKILHILKNLEIYYGVPFDGFFYNFTKHRVMSYTDVTCEEIKDYIRECDLKIDNLKLQKQLGRELLKKLQEQNDA